MHNWLFDLNNFSFGDNLIIPSLNLNNPWNFHSLDDNLVNDRRDLNNFLLNNGYFNSSIDNFLHLFY